MLTELFKRHWIFFRYFQHLYRPVLSNTVIETSGTGWQLRNYAVRILRLTKHLAVVIWKEKTVAFKMVGHHTILGFDRVFTTRVSVAMMPILTSDLGQTASN